MPYADRCRNASSRIEFATRDSTTNAGYGNSVTLNCFQGRSGDYSAIDPPENATATERNRAMESTRAFAISATSASFANSPSFEFMT